MPALDLTFNTDGGGFEDAGRLTEAMDKARDSLASAEKRVEETNRCVPKSLCLGKVVANSW